MSRCCSLCFLRVAETAACGAERFRLSLNAEALQRSDSKLFAEQGGTVVFLPEPIVKGRERGAELLFVRAS
jgi:hypothetical protein